MLLTQRIFPPNDTDSCVEQWGIDVNRTAASVQWMVIECQNLTHTLGFVWGEGLLFSSAASDGGDVLLFTDATRGSFTNGSVAWPTWFTMHAQTGQVLSQQRVAPSVLSECLSTTAAATPPWPPCWTRPILPGLTPCRLYGMGSGGVGVLLQASQVYDGSKDYPSFTEGTAILQGYWDRSSGVFSH